MLTMIAFGLVCAAFLVILIQFSFLAASFAVMLPRIVDRARSSRMDSCWIEVAVS